MSDFSPLLMGSNSRSTEGSRSPSLDDDCSYFPNMFGPSLEVRLVTLARYVRHIYVA